MLHEDEKDSKNEAKKLKIIPHYSVSSSSSSSSSLKYFAKVLSADKSSITADYFIENQELVLAISGGEKFGGNGNLSVQPYQNDFQGDLQHFGFERNSMKFFEKKNCKQKVWVLRF